MSRLALFFALALLALAPFVSADIPRLISLQGQLTDASDNPITSSANFAFRIYDTPTGGTALWTEFQTLAPNSLGIFSSLLGSVAALNIPFNESYWLEVQVNSEVLSPRTRMGSAGYAIRSENPWNATGNDIYATNAGNVGIGTATPAQKLTVSGDVSWTGTLQGGIVPWARLASFPSACPPGQYASAIGSSLTCSAPAGGLTGTKVLMMYYPAGGWSEPNSFTKTFTLPGSTCTGTITACREPVSRPTGYFNRDLCFERNMQNLGGNNYKTEIAGGSSTVLSVGAGSSGTYTGVDDEGSYYSISGRLCGCEGGTGGGNGYITFKENGVIVADYQYGSSAGGTPSGSLVLRGNVEITARASGNCNCGGSSMSATKTSYPINYVGASYSC